MSDERVVDDGDERRNDTRAFLQELGVGELHDRPCVLTGWVVVTEWMDDTGHRFLLRGFDHNVPVWQALGMVQFAMRDDGWEPDDTGD